MRSKNNVLTTVLAFLMVALVFLLIPGPTFAQDTTTTTTTTDTSTTATDETASTDSSAIQFGLLSMGQDNLFLYDFKDKEWFLAIGGGFDILKFEKALNYGGTLCATLHATAAARVTGNTSSAMVGGSLNFDMVKLISGTGLTLMGKDLSVVFGPAIAYDTTNGKFAGGLNLNFSYSF